VIGVDDFFYLDGSMLARVAPEHLATLTVAIAMTAVAIIGLTYRAQRKRFRLSWDSLGLLALYGVGLAMLRLLA
jgi:cation:H+ antiporter